MEKKLAFFLALILAFSIITPTSAASKGQFVLTAANASSVLIEPEYVSFSDGQTVRQALLASAHEITFSETGMITEIDGKSGDFTAFFDNGSFDLNAEASAIQVLCVGISSQYSKELISLIEQAAQYSTMGNVCHYPPARTAYASALAAIRYGGASAAREASDALTAAIAQYRALMNGEKYTVTVSATQNGVSFDRPTVTLTDAYGNTTSAVGTALRVVAGEYTFCVSDGGYNRTEGSLTVTSDTVLNTTLPYGEWFGAVRLLDRQREAYPCTQNTREHTATYQIPDTAAETSSLYLNVEQGAVPNTSATVLKTIYVGLDGIDYSEQSRSWESTSTSLLSLVSQGMEGSSLTLEAQYTNADGHIQIQSYAMTLDRTPTLSALSVTAGGAALTLAFDPTVYTYDIATISDTVDLSATPFGANYKLTGTGIVSTGRTHTISVEANGKKAEYRLKLVKKSAAAVTLSAESGVEVALFNAMGSTILPKNGVYSLIPDEAYTYRTTKNGLYHAEHTFLAADGLHLNAATPIVEDRLTAFALYNSSNVNSRVEYAPDTAFSADRHSYTFTISDYNTAVYAQATSKYTVTAHYTTQTLSPSTHGVEKAVNLTKEVSADGATDFLTQLIARSGFGNFLTVRVSSVENDVTHYQDYTFRISRKLHLKTLSATAEGRNLSLMDAEGISCTFHRDTTDYFVNVSKITDTLYLSAEFPNVSDATDCCGGYYALINGARYDVLSNTALPLNTALDTEHITIDVRHSETDAQVTSYTLTVCKTEPVSVTFRTTPTDAVVYLVDTADGTRMLDTNGVFSLYPSGSYRYSVTCSGYQGISESFTAPAAPQTITVELKKAEDNRDLQPLTSVWPHQRLNDDNNAVCASAAPTEEANAVLYWATKLGDGYDRNTCGSPILADGYLYTYAGSTVYKLDTVSGQIVASGKMDHPSSYAINSPTYADGMLFIGLSDGTVQAFNAATLESLWLYRDPLGGQPNCPIVYHNGYLYTGFWVGESSQASFVCLTATDEDPSSPNERKTAAWRYPCEGGFYWAGAYVHDGYLLVGTEDGTSNAALGSSALLSIDPISGKLIDRYSLRGVGDIRSSITACDGKYYFTAKGGWFFEATVSASGKIERVRSLVLGGMSTSTPTVYRGRAYVGVCGSDQFGTYSGHGIAVIELANWEIAYFAQTQGYVQSSGILSTAYEEATGDVFVYFFDNYTPGKLRLLRDRAGQTEPSPISTETDGSASVYDTAYALFTPYGAQAQYTISSPIMDEYGTLYFKNDSAHIMAVGSTIERLEIVEQPRKTTYQVGERFEADGLRVTAHYTNGTSRDVTEYLLLSHEPLQSTDRDFTLMLPYVLYQNLDGKAGVGYPEPIVTLSLTILGDTMFGDVNGDGEITPLDAVCIVRYLNGALTLSDETAADVSGDGKITMTDASMIVQYLSGKVNDFPAARGR